MKFGRLQVSACIAAMIGAGLGVQEAEAVIVTVGGSEVVFDSGGYEAETFGSLPGTPTIGFYQTANPAGVAAVTGLSPAAGGPTGAFADSNYMSINRTALGANGNSWLSSQFGRGIDPLTESFTVEFAVWGTPDTSHFGMSVGGPAADGTGSSTPEVLSSWGYNANLTSLVSFSSAGSVPLPSSTAAWNIGQWNTMLYAWDAGAAAATLSVNGDTPETIINQIDNPTVITQFHVRANSGASHVHLDVAGTPILAGDINGDGFVGIADLNIVLGNWNAGTPPGTGNATIPEPASVALLGLGGIAMLRRRR